MGVVTKTHTHMVGDVTEEIQYYFESYEDFIKFEEFIKVEEDEHDPDEGGTSADVVEGRKYVVVGNTSDHEFPLGEIVIAECVMDGVVRCSDGLDSWHLEYKELEEV